MAFVFRVLWQVHQSVETDQANRLIYREILVMQNKLFRLWRQECIASTRKDCQKA